MIILSLIELSITRSRIVHQPSSYIAEPAPKILCLQLPHFVSRSPVPTALEGPLAGEVSPSQSVCAALAVLLPGPAGSWRCPPPPGTSPWPHRRPVSPAQPIIDLLPWAAHAYLAQLCAPQGMMLSCSPFSEPRPPKLSSSDPQTAPSNRSLCGHSLLNPCGPGKK